MNSRRNSRMTLTVLLATALAACSSPAPGPGAPPTTKKPTEASTAAITPAASVPFAQSALVVLQARDSDHAMLWPVDPATGYPVSEYAPVDLGVNFYYRATPDGKTLIFVSYAAAEGSPAEVRFLDLNTWHEAVGMELPSRGGTSALAVSADGTRFALATAEHRQSSLWLVDVSKHVLMKHVQTPLYVAGLDFTTDSSSLMIYGRQERADTGLSAGPPMAELRSAQDLDLLWSRTLTSVRDGFEPGPDFKGVTHEPGAGSTYRPAIVFSAASDTLYLVHADVDRLTRVDFARKSTVTLDIQPRRSWFERLLVLGTRTAHAKVQDGIERQAVISPDGTTIYSAGLQNKITKATNGEWEFAQTALQLQAIRAADGVEVFRSEAAGDSVSLSDDGLTILLRRWNYAKGKSDGTIEVSAANGEILKQTAGLDLRPTHRMDGSPLLVAAMPPRTPYEPYAMSVFTPEMASLGNWEARRFGDWVILP